MEILFVHGAGGYRDDLPLAGHLRATLDVTVSYPEFPGDDMSAAAWRAGIQRQLDVLGPDVAVVGHSFGASMALLHLAGHFDGITPLGLVLLAMPYWGSDGWQAGYGLPEDAGLPADLPLRLHHCVDDDTVPVDHMDRHAARLPQALVRRYPSGGHQFEGRMPEVANDVAALIR